jgi:hypothetical protein
MRKKDLKRRLNGFSLPIVGGGAQWETVESNRASAHRVLTFLADRRVLFNPYWQEQAGECAASVLGVRRKLTDEIGQLHDDEDLVPHLTTMQGACRQFLDRIGSVANEDRRLGLWAAYRELDLRDVPLLIGLGELRSTIGIQVGLVATMFDIDVPDTLVEILLPPPDDGAELNFDLHRPL